MKDEDLKRSIEEALAVEPSPEFAARVRRRIGSEHQSPWIRLPWVQVAAGIAVAAVLISAVVLFPGKDTTSKPSAVAETKQTPSPSKGATMPRVEVPRPAPVVAEAMSKPRRTEPEVLIDPREAAAFYRFLDDVQQQRIDPSGLEALLQASERALTIEEITPMPIAAIEPIDVPPLNSLVPDSEGGSL